MKVDWDVETDGGGTYEPGVYKVKIKEITEVEAKSGNMQLRIKTEIVDGPGHVGKQLTEHITLLEQVMWKLIKFLKACGVDTKKQGAMDTESAKFRALLNKLYGKTTCWTVDVIKNRDGKDVNDITDYNEDPDANKWDEEKEEEPQFLNE